MNPTNDQLQTSVQNANQSSQDTNNSLGSIVVQVQPCGIIDEICQIIDLNIVKCDHQGLNKYACLNIKTQPCIWIKNNDQDFEHCEERIPEGYCEEQNGNEKLNVSVNAILCSMVQENDPCSYDSSKQKCKKPDDNLTYCDVEGINVYGCVQIKNCYYQNQKCQLFDPNLNLTCKDVQFANELVCSQIKNDGCKHNLLEFGCIQSSILDSCSTSGINMNGCNSNEQCQWNNEKCQCKMLLDLYKDCSEHIDYLNCINSDKCYFEQTMFIENLGICKEKQCNDNNLCNYELYKGKICYQNFNGQCIEATSCDQIKGPSINCSIFSFNDLQCVSDGNDGCIQFQSCENLSRIQCINYSDYCILLNSCITKQCHHISDQYQCINFDCAWINKQCINQIQCSEILQEKDCNNNQYQGVQCTWNLVKNDNIDTQICTSEGCNFLHKNSSCQGTQIGQSVCLQTQDLICLSCEQISDICECMEKVEYCTYNIQKNRCISQPCQNYNKQSCPKNRCYFYEQHQICIPQCQFQSSKTQCQKLTLCIWDEYQRPPCIDTQYVKDNVLTNILVDKALDRVLTLIPFFLLLQL
ncbi:unnamed protein product [Paramecium primaurelia]|nr:unnamed protein product [Paramecium primaurelia]